MATWLEDVTAAITKIGGKGSLDEIYNAVLITRSQKLSKNWRAIVRRTIEENSSDSDAFKNKNNGGCPR